MDNIDVTAIIVSYNTAGLLGEAIGRLMDAAQGKSLQIVIVDNASKDNSAALIRQIFPACHLIVNEENVGFGRANNQALPLAKGRYVLLLNTDAFVSPDTISKTIAYMDANPKCGILGARLVGRDGALQPCARYFPTPWNLFLARTGLARIFRNVRMVDDMGWDHASVRQCDWVPGCYYLIRREVIAQIGLFDPRFFLYYEEIDHCYAAKRAGWDVTYFPDATVIHIGGESAKSEGQLTQNGRQLQSLQVESELLYFRKNLGAAGVWANVTLALLADAINALKQLLKRRSASAAFDSAMHATLLWTVFRRTGGGVRPTR